MTTITPSMNETIREMDLDALYHVVNRIKDRIADVTLDALVTEAKGGDGLSTLKAYDELLAAFVFEVKRREELRRLDRKYTGGALDEMMIVNELVADPEYPKNNARGIAMREYVASKTGTSNNRERLDRLKGQLNNG